MRDVLYLKRTKILIPLDGTERSMHSLDWLKKFFSKNSIEITLMNVMDIITANNMVIPNQFEYLQEESELILEKAVKELIGYRVEKFTTYGHAGDEILKKAKEDSYDIIIMTKSNKKGLPRIIGSVTSKVVRNAQVSVIVIPE